MNKIKLWQRQNSRLIMVATTRRPFDLDESFLTYLPIRLYVPKPTFNMMQSYMVEFNNGYMSTVPIEPILELLRRTHELSMFEFLSFLAYVQNAMMSRYSDEQIALMNSNETKMKLSKKELEKALDMFKPIATEKDTEDLMQWMEAFGSFYQLGQFQHSTSTSTSTILE